MQIVRTIVWVLLLVALLLFSMANWSPVVTVRIWEGIVLDTKLPAIVIVSFLIGFVPMWLFHRASKWRMTRKIASLENAARTAATTPVAPPREPEPTSTAGDLRSDPETPLRPAEPVVVEEPETAAPPASDTAEGKPTLL